MRCSAVDVYYAFAHYGWHLKDGVGAVVFKGEDFAEIGADGCLRSMVGCFEPQVAVTA